MYCYRPVARRAPSTIRIIQPSRSASASFFPAPSVPRFPTADFNSLFRALDDFPARGFNLDHLFTPAYAHQARAPQQSIVTPKFDVQETATGYELRGEVPGIESQDLSVEFTDPQTLSISGQTARESSRGTPPAPAATPSETAPPAETETTKAVALDAEADAENSDAASTYSSGSYQKPTVEEADAAAAESSTDAQARATPTTSEAGDVAEQATVSTSSAQQNIGTTQAEQPEAQASRYWVSERSTGSFQRTFKFPDRINQDGVEASLRNGVLTIVVPKAPAPTVRSIKVQ